MGEGVQDTIRRARLTYPAVSAAMQFPSCLSSCQAWLSQDQSQNGPRWPARTGHQQSSLRRPKCAQGITSSRKPVGAATVDMKATAVVHATRCRVHCDLGQARAEGMKDEFPLCRVRAKWCCDHVMRGHWSWDLRIAMHICKPGIPHGRSPAKGASLTERGVIRQCHAF